MTEAAIELLPRARVAEAVEVLARAFVHDPIFCHYFPDADDRHRVLSAFFNDLVRANMRSGHVYCALDGDKVVGAAVWRPPSAGVPSLVDRLRSRLAARRVQRISRSAASNLFAGFETLESLHPQRPHWHLMFIGVDTTARLRHIGSSLMQPVLSLADQRRELCYLETPFPETHVFYERLGFEITSTRHPFRDAPTIWIMSREPRQAMCDDSARLRY